MGSELKGVPLSASPNFTHFLLLVLANSLVKSWKTSSVLRTEEWLNILDSQNALKVNTGKCSFWAHMKKNK